MFRGAHSKIFWRGVTYFGTNFLRVYILEVGVTRGATMVGAERKNFKTLNSLDLRKASCRAQKGIRFRQCIMAIAWQFCNLIYYFLDTFQKRNLTETKVLRNACTGRLGPTNGSFGTDFLNYFSK